MEIQQLSDASARLGGHGFLVSHSPMASAPALLALLQHQDPF